MNKIFVSGICANKPEDWKSLLAKSEHWKNGHSAKALASCWQETEKNDFPESVRRAFNKSGIGLFQNIELLLALPEYKVVLPGGEHPSQNDIFVLATGDNRLISITVEGKVSETFGPTVGEWLKENYGGKKERLDFLLNKLGLKNDKINHIRYQLLHRTASAVIEAERFGAKNALMLIHSFSPADHPKGFPDYSEFLDLFHLKAEQDSLVGPKNISGIDLYFGWANGEIKN
ncbi:MAG: hypothetical protein MUP17_10965 [candidate division Zixibacteria bacterium]|nr:hypothetical protein [candidate division Zixibacteria bacterium]